MTQYNILAQTATLRLNTERIICPSTWVNLTREKCVKSVQNTFYTCVVSFQSVAHVMRVHVLLNDSVCFMKLMGETSI